MICCTDPELTEALYILYIHVYKTSVTCKLGEKKLGKKRKKKLDNGKILLTVTDKRQAWPLIRVGAPQ
jgi:hypothetical protein